MKRLILVLLFLASIVFVPKTFAENNSFVSIVNPVRGSDFWDQKDQLPETAVLGQIASLKNFNLPATWLLRFDVFDNKNIIDQLKSRPLDEKGLFLEVTPSWVNQAKVDYRKSGSWHTAGSAFLTGYERGEREKLIDASFEKFKNIFGYYPVTVGAWWIDSYSLGYMQKKFGIVGALIVSDQYSTDNYQIWGQYFGTPYYPAKNNALHPAQSLDNKLNVVMMQWAPRDPVNGYGNGVLESTFSVQSNDYIDYHNLDIKYFSSLIEIYTNQKFNQFAHIVVGLENSYQWSKYSQEYGKQIGVLAEKMSTGKLSVVTMKDFAIWYADTFPKLSPRQIIVADDPLGSFKKVVWFMDPYFRAGWFFNSEGSVFRDIRQYTGGEEELCFQTRCESVNFATTATRVLDSVSFGHKWMIDQGKITNFQVNSDGEKIIISYNNEAGNLRRIGLLARDISIDEKTFSIDSTILNAIKQENAPKKNITTEDKSLRWSLISSMLKVVEFALFIILVIILPGFILTNKFFVKTNPFLLRLFVSLGVGLTVLPLLFYIISLTKIKPLIFAYILLNLIIFIRFKFYKFLTNLPKITKPFNLITALIILAGVIFQTLPTFKSGLTFAYGMGFWGPNTHDGVWHLALINQLTESMPAQNPVFSGTILKNYHFFYDLLVAATNYISTLPVNDLVFRLYPIIFSAALGIGSYYLVVRLFGNILGEAKTKITILFSLYLIYFAGSFGWIVEYLREKHFGGESAFWVNQAVSFNLNPPFAISLVILITLLHLLLSSFSQKKGKIVTIVLFGTLISFKSYTGILMLATLMIIAVINLLKRRSFSYLWIAFLSSLLAGWLFISNFEATSTLVTFAPFWFIHSMIDSPDRVGWYRLSLARNSSQALGQWPKFILVEILSLILFVVGNLGLRFLSFGLVVKIKKVFQDDVLLFIFILAILSMCIPILFIQSGNPWNTIQFFYPALYISAIFSGVVISTLIFKLNKILAFVLICIILILVPINSAVTASGYLSNLPHAFVSSLELSGLKFLSAQPDGIILTYPYDEKLKQTLSEPWPLLAYDSTAYISALTKKATYLEDEPQNQILLTDYKKRVVASKDFFLKPITENVKFLQDNHIKYIYLPKIFNIRLEEGTKFVKNIFENEEIVIYKVN
ncbi:MAG: hypothetical protein M1365_01570 [Actinobacteria bacterium]|nr:hypothetical protein [Actinomycetota bacterium]